MKRKSSKPPQDARLDTGDETPKAEQSSYASERERSRTAARPKLSKHLGAAAKPGAPRMSRVIPPKPKLKYSITSIRLPKDFVERIDKIREKEGYSRNEVFFLLLKWAVEQHEADEQGLERTPNTARTSRDK